MAETVAHGHHEKIANGTKHDKHLQIVMRFIMYGWPNCRANVPLAKLPYWNYRDELSLYDGVIFRGKRICIPKKIRSMMLKIIHSSHSGMVRGKQRATNIFWPGINKQIEEIVSKCEVCLERRNRKSHQYQDCHGEK